jgi:guanylate kinase
MAFLDISPADTLRTYRLRAKQAVVAAWAEAVELCVAALTAKDSKGTGSNVIVKGSVGGAAVSRTASGKASGVVLQPAQQQEQQQSLQYADGELSDTAAMSRRIAEREKAVMQLESDMTLVNSMFKDVANIVTSQNDQLNSIEQHIDSTVERVERGMGDLTVAHKRC